VVCKKGGGGGGGGGGGLGVLKGIAICNGIKCRNLGLFLSRLAHSFYIQTQQMQVTICAVELNDHVTWAQIFVSK